MQSLPLGCFENKNRNSGQLYTTHCHRFSARTSYLIASYRYVSALGSFWWQDTSNWLDHTRQSITQLDLLYRLRWSATTRDKLSSRSASRFSTHKQSKSITWKRLELTSAVIITNKLHHLATIATLLSEEITGASIYI